MVLGSLLFLLYINDISDSINIGKLVSYIDETALLIMDDNLNAVRKTEVSIKKWFYITVTTASTTKTSICGMLGVSFYNVPYVEVQMVDAWTPERSELFRVYVS